MRILISLFIMASFLISCQNAGNKTAVQATAIKTIEVSVKGMSCTGCENTIKESVSKIAGVTECTASFKENKAIVKFDSTKTNFTALSAAITDAGYEVIGQKVIK